MPLTRHAQTHGGAYRPFNRTGISAKSSPLLKASFETTVAFLSEATLHGDFDDLSSPAGRIVMGQPSRSGTGAFDIRAPKRL
jgi:DNA-directed RNA polymerase I subunit RPA1